MIPVEGYSGLVRDEKTSAIVAVNRSEYQAFIEQHRARTNQANRIAELEEIVRQLQRHIERQNG